MKMPWAQLQICGGDETIVNVLAPSNRKKVEESHCSTANGKGAKHPGDAEQRQK